MAERVYGITASTPTEPDQLLAVETTQVRADKRVAEGVGNLLAGLLPDLQPGAQLAVLIRRGDEVAGQLVSTASVSLTEQGERRAWDFTVSPYQIEPEEIPL